MSVSQLVAITTILFDHSSPFRAHTQKDDSYSSGSSYGSSYGNTDSSDYSYNVSAEFDAGACAISALPSFVIGWFVASACNL